MQRLVCFSLFLLFTVFTFRSSVLSEDDKIASASATEESYPISDEDSNTDSDSSESEDLEDLDLQIEQPLSLNVVSLGSKKLIQLQQHIFNSLPIEVITPPPQV